MLGPLRGNITPFSLLFLKPNQQASVGRVGGISSPLQLIMVKQCSQQNAEISFPFGRFLPA